MPDIPLATKIQEMTQILAETYAACIHWRVMAFPGEPPRLQRLATQAAILHDLEQAATENHGTFLLQNTEEVPHADAS